MGNFGSFTYDNKCEGPGVFVHQLLSDTVRGLRMLIPSTSFLQGRQVKPSLGGACRGRRKHPQKKRCKCSSLEKLKLRLQR